MSEPAIMVSGLSKRYGDRLAVDDLSFEVPAGEVTGLVGPNGAGKTTTIRMLLGLIRPTAGSAQILGSPLDRLDRFLPRVGALIEGPAFTPALSGRANLSVLARLGGIGPASVEGVLALVGLRERAGDPVRAYSLGMRQRLGIAAALLPSPDLLVLDEPTNGLDPAGILEVRGLLRELAAEGTSIVVSSHLLAEIEAACTHLVVLVGGRLGFSGGVEAFRGSRKVALRLTPESPEDLARLASLCARLMIDVRIDGESLVADAPASRAAELNRMSMDEGITLCGLGAEIPSLEQAFLARTEVRA